MMGIEMMKDTRQRPRLSLLDHLLLTLLLTVFVNKLHVVQGMREREREGVFLTFIVPII